MINWLPIDQIPRMPDQLILGWGPDFDFAVLKWRDPAAYPHWQHPEGYWFCEAWGCVDPGMITHGAIINPPTV